MKNQNKPAKPIINDIIRQIAANKSYLRRFLKYTLDDHQTYVTLYRKHEAHESIISILRERHPDIPMLFFTMGKDQLLILTHKSTPSCRLKKMVSTIREISINFVRPA